MIIEELHAEVPRSLISGYRGLLYGEHTGAVFPMMWDMHLGFAYESDAWLVPDDLEDTRLLLPLDEATARAWACQQLFPFVKGQHGKPSGAWHDMDPVGPARVVCFPTDDGGATVRLDFCCRGCGGGIPDWVFLHQQHLLPYVSAKPGRGGYPGHYRGAEQIAQLDATDPKRLPDGSRHVDALALKILIETLVGQAASSSDSPPAITK
jgi:hypothetical protein